MQARPPVLARWGWLLALIILCAPLPGASITGAVIENATGRPLARSKVILQVRGAARAAGATAQNFAHNGAAVSGSIAAGSGTLRQLTGSHGQFSFADLPAGIYFLRAERKGYAAVEYGQKSFEEPGTPIVLEEHSDFSAILRLPRLGAVAGAVVDENQVGLEDVPVHAYRIGQTWRAAASTVTDDRGIYRLSGLRPGRYLIHTAAKQIEGGAGLLPTYYGHTIRAADAQVLEVRLDREVEGVDIAPGPGRLARLTGRLVGASAAEVILLTEAGPRRSRVREGARFDFGYTEPGRYTLLVEPASAGGNLAALAEVTVSTEDLEVAVGMEAAPLLTVDCASAGGAPIDTRGVAIFVRRPDFDGHSERLACGERQVWGPGDWEIAVATPAHYYVEAILETNAGEDSRRFRATPGEHRRVTVLLREGPATISGVVTLDGEPVVGAPVFLDAVDEELRGRAGGVRSTRADARGQYSFAGLPPGRYEVVSSYQLRNAEQERWTPGLGAIADLSPNDETILNLQLTRIP